MRGNGLMIVVVGGTTTTSTTTQQLMQLTGVENPESGEAIHTFGFVMKQFRHVRTFTYATLNKRHELCPHNLTPLQIDKHPKGFLA